MRIGGLAIPRGGRASCPSGGHAFATLLLHFRPAAASVENIMIQRVKMSMRGSHPTDPPRNNHLPRLKVPRRRVTLSLLNKIEALSQSLDKDTKEGVQFEEDEPRR